MGKYLSINTQLKIQMLDLLSVMRCLGFWASFWASFWATFITHTQFYAETIEHVWYLNDIFKEVRTCFF